jgi:protoheme ferro-lyase
MFSYSKIEWRNFETRIAISFDLDHMMVVWEVARKCQREYRPNAHKDFQKRETIGAQMATVDI